MRGLGGGRGGLQVMRERMRRHIKQRRRAPEFEEYLLVKVRAGRASARAGRGRANEAVEAEFVARRVKAMRSA